MDDSELDLDDDRAVELSSIAAIYPELIISPSDRYSATLDLAVTPITPLNIRFLEPPAKAAPLITPPTSIEAGPSDNDRNVIDVGAGARDKNGRNEAVDTAVHEIEHLPPVRIEFTLPDGYPSEKPPVVKLSVSPAWLSKEKLEELSADCTKLWEELGRDQTIYMFIDNLQQEAENAFGLLQGKENIVPFPADLQLELLDFNLKTKREKFENETFDCGVCLEPKKGKECHRLLMCGHVFCIACLQDFYNNCIKEGDVDHVKCMDPTCGKDASSPQKKRKQHTLNPSELLTIPIEQDLVQRYVRLKRKKRLESDKDVIYCPRQWCQGPSRSKKHPKPDNPMDDFVSDTESEAEREPKREEPPPSDKKKKKDDADAIPMSQRLCVCEDCDFAFCLVCQKSWHGEFGACLPRRRKELEEEEKASLAYLRHYSTPCPTCDAPCQKSHGCNHMICFRCRTHFCYLCSAWLIPDNPYKHFNTHGSNCYMRLWELEAGDGEGVVQRQFEQWGMETDDEEDEDEDTDDEEPAEPIDMADMAREVNAIAPEINPPAQQNAPQPPPQERAIEFVNFAAQGGRQGGRRIIIPNQVEEPPAPVAAPAEAPRRQPRRPRAQPPAPNDRHPARRARQQRHHQQQQQQAQRRQGNNVINIPPAAPRAPAAAAAPANGGGGGNAADALHRFIQLAQQQREDEWDSDELDELEFGDGDDLDDDDDDDDGDDEHDHALQPPLRRPEGAGQPRLLRQRMR